MSTVLCITGMHRSGTSLTAEWLQRCGVVLDFGGLVPAGIGNTRGHFEDAEIMALHEAQFLARRRWSKGWLLRRPAALTLTRAGEARAREIVRRRDERLAQWGWKDPRTVAFLGERTLLVPHLSVLLLWRPAADVVASLLRRAQQNPLKTVQVRSGDAWRCWVSYNTLVAEFRSARPQNTLLLPLSSLVADDAKTLGLLRSRLGLTLHDEDLAGSFERGLLQPQPAPDLSDCPRRLREQVERLEERLSGLSDLP